MLVVPYNYERRYFNNLTALLMFEERIRETVAFWIETVKFYMLLVVLHSLLLGWFCFLTSFPAMFCLSSVFVCRSEAFSPAQGIKL